MDEVLHVIEQDRVRKLREAQEREAAEAAGVYGDDVEDVDIQAHFEAFRLQSTKSNNNHGYSDTEESEGEDSESGGIQDDDSDVPDLDGDRARGYDGKFYDVDDPKYEWKTGRTPSGDV